MDKPSGQEKITNFFKAEYNKLVNYVRKNIDDSAQRDAEDIVQDVVLNLYDRADIMAPIEDLSSYIYRSLKNKIIDLFRNNKMDISIDAPISEIPPFSLKDILFDHRVNIESEAEKNELYQYLYNAIDSLNTREKAVIIASEFENHTFQELSNDWDIPLGTLLARKSRALKKIQKALLKYKKIYMED
ncbi:MAG: sigma-70 family RNA polymerase sigma factor [Spirochaetes bacterium]|nr:sigma-70 family RNA polymerase sigma factor [Spirochaetota bacterium]